MANLTLTMFESFKEALAEKKHNFQSDTFKFQLLATAPDAAADAVEADLPADLSTGNGYTSGGVAISATSTAAQADGIYECKKPLTDMTATGSVGPFRYLVIFNDTAANDELYGYLDYGENITLKTGDYVRLIYAASLFFTME